MNKLNKHWDKIFSAKADSKLGWYEDDVSQTLKFLDMIPKDEEETIFLAGAGTSILVDKLMAQGRKIILNDISEEALAKLKKRIGTNDGLTWLRHDISKPLPDGISNIDIWIDRAVLHFILEEEDIKNYFVNLQSAISRGGHVLLAEFSTTGAPSCAGLVLHRYSIEEMTERLGKDFELIKSENYTYINPNGDPRPYIYALYRKNIGIQGTQI